MPTDPSPTDRRERSPSSDEFHRALGEHLARIERDGTRALDEFQQKHPQHAARLGKQIDWLMQHLGKRGEAGVPKQIGPFRVLQKLGAGGMGAVFLCEQTQPFQRIVAVKVIRADRAAEGRVSRFLSEIQALASLNHDGIAKVFEAGLDQGSPYFAMEYVPGVPISDYCIAERLDLAARLHLFTRVCRAVEHAHRNGILHRDLKPSNILVYGPATEPVVKIIDFGLAKAIAPDADAAKRTMTGQMLGTPDYMSPEQVDDGPGHGVDTRADVYALGVVLYELLTGVLPLSLWQMGREDLRAMLQAIRERKPSSPSKRVEESSETDAAGPAIGNASPRRLSRMLQGDLDAIVMKALHKDAGSRYGSTAELAEDVLRHLRHEPVRARDATRAYVLYKFVRRNRAAVAFAITVLVLSFAGLVTVNVLAQQSIRNLERSELFGIAHYLECLEEQDAEPEAARPENLPTLQARLGEFERVLAERPRLQAFLDRNPTPLAAANGWASGSEPTTALRAVVERTVHRMHELQQPRAQLERLRARVDWAKDVVRQTIDLHAAAWQRVRAEVKADVRFRELDLRPQSGLVPLRRHPTTGLQEFAMQLPGGQLPQLGAKGYEVGPDTCPVFVLLPGGRVRIGSQADDPNQPNYDPGRLAGEPGVQEVDIAPFFASEFEFTAGQWDLVAPYECGQDATHPIHSITSTQMQHVLRAWGMRLPSGRQWEHLARAGTDTPYWCGKDGNSLHGKANVFDRSLLAAGKGEGQPALFDDGFPTTAPVGSFGANAWLMHDVHGNVIEAVRREPKPGGKSVLEFRGGSWHQGVEAARITWSVWWYGHPVPSVGCRPVIEVLP
jgi:serine/threonine protein kinase/formylglycine-generating enzyme required for sulfatase activity